MFVSVHTGAVVGIDAVEVTVEVNITGGGLGLHLVGLPDNAVKESEQRIRAAFENSGEHMSGKKVVVNLAPADLRKEGAAFDLPIAVGILGGHGADRDRIAGRYAVCGRAVARRLSASYPRRSPYVYSRPLPWLRGDDCARSERSGGCRGQ